MDLSCMSLVGCNGDDTRSDEERGSEGSPDSVRQGNGQYGEAALDPTEGPSRNGGEVRLPNGHHRLTDQADAEESGSTGSGGRLRFFLAGRCVLELAHDTDDDGKPKQWVQTSSKSYYPRPATWTPSTVVHEKHERKSPFVQGSGDPSLLPRRNVGRRGSCYPFVLLRRHDSPNHVSGNFTLSQIVLRRVARNPLRPVVVNREGGDMTKTLSAGRPVGKKLSFAQKAENLFRLVESLHVGQWAATSQDCRARADSPVAEKPIDTTLELLTGSDSSFALAYALPPAPRLDERLPLAPTNKESVVVAVAPRKGSFPACDDEPSDLNSPANPQLMPLAVSIKLTDVASSASGEDCRGKECTTAGRCFSPPTEEGCHRRYDVVDGSCDSPRKRVFSATLDGRVTPRGGGIGEEVLPAGGRVLQKKRRRGAYGRGRTIGEAVRNFVIHEILDLGGDPRTKYVPRGVFTEVGLRYKVDATTTYRWWLKYCDALKAGGGGVLPAAEADSSHVLEHSASDVALRAPSTPRSTASFTPPSVARFLMCHSAADGSKRSLRPPAACHSRTVEAGARTFPRAEQSMPPCSDFSLQDSSVNSHSPMSNDSQSSSASIVDPASLYASFVHASAFPQPLSSVVPLASSMAGSACRSLTPISGTGHPLPVGVCLNYMWSLPPTASVRSNGVLAGRASPLHHEKDDGDSADEPLDLTLPKKCFHGGRANASSSNCNSNKEAEILSVPRRRSRSQSGGAGAEQGGPPLSTTNSCREWKPDPCILKTLMRSQGDPRNPPGVVLQSPDFGGDGQGSPVYSILNNGTPPPRTVTPLVQLRSCATTPHRNMKPKHYPFLSLQIGTFEIHSNVSSEGDIPNKFKVIFTKRKFVYEFETADGMETSGSRQMACIVVPFSTVEAFWCCDASIVLRVVSKPFMFLGQRHRQVGCVPSLTVYETKKSVDLTGGQLGVADVHKVTLLKPHLVERLKICLVLFDVRFRDLMAPLPLHNIATGERDVDE